MKNVFEKMITSFLFKCAKRAMQRHRPFVIVVMGACGKESAVSAIYQVLEDKFQGEVSKTGSLLISEIEVPLAILGYKIPNILFWPFFLIGAYLKSYGNKFPKYLVLAEEIARKGDVSKFLNLISPDIAVITSLGDYLPGSFDSLDEYAKEIISIKDLIKEDGKIVANIDDSLFPQADFPNLISVGVDNQEATYFASDLKTTLCGSDYRILTVGQKIAIKTILLGREQIYSQLFAFAVGQYFNIQSLKIKASIERMVPSQGKLNIVNSNNISIIDDSLNDNPSSILESISIFENLESKGRRVLLLGKNIISEEGQRKEKIKKTLSDSIGRFDIIIFVGQNAEFLRREIDDHNKLVTFDTDQNLVGHIKSSICDGDLILIEAMGNLELSARIIQAVVSPN